MSVAGFLQEHPELFIRQRKELVEILVDWETGNQYSILDAQENELGYVAEKRGGIGRFLLRGFLRSHRPLEVSVVDRQGQELLHLSRPFFFLFSSLSVTGADGRPMGHVQRRFGILYKRYDLIDATAQCFARIKAPRWRLWTFPVLGQDGASEATISKKWGGMLREVFTDADTFRLDFGTGNWSPEQRTILLAAAISIDFDFFENQQMSGGLFD